MLADLVTISFNSFGSYNSSLEIIPNLSLSGVAREPALVVAPN